MELLAGLLEVRFTAAVNGAGEAVDGVVGHGQRLVEIGGLEHRQNRAEYLLLGQPVA